MRRKERIMNWWRNKMQRKRRRKANEAKITRGRRGRRAYTPVVYPINPCDQNQKV